MNEPLPTPSTPNPELPNDPITESPDSSSQLINSSTHQLPPNPQLPNPELPNPPITQSPIPDSQSPIPKSPIPKSPLPLILGGVALLVLLAAIAFLAGKFIRTPETASDPFMAIGPGGEVVGNFVAGPGGGGGGGTIMDSGGVAIQIDFKPAPELPTYQPEVSGILVRREDNRLFIGTGAISISIVGGEGEAPVMGDPAYEGDEVEVVIEKETKIYMDTTQMEPPSQPGELASQTIQQSVAPGSLDDLTSQSMLTVWGRKTGDRVVAEVLLYSQPVIFSMPAAAPAP